MEFQVVRIRQRGGGRSGAGAAGLLAMLAALASIPAYVIFETWSELQAMKRAWTIAGPPCPVVERPASWAVNHHRAPRTSATGRRHSPGNSAL
jgi:hypothetical protein